MIELLKFSHDRKAPFKQSCDALRDTIDAFAEQSELDEWYRHFEIKYFLPREIVKQQMKAHLASSYDYKKCKFLEKFSVKNCLKSALKYIGFIAYVISQSKKYGYINKSYELIVEGIETDEEVKRFSKLIRLFNNVLFVNIGSATGLGFEIINRPRYKYYDRNIVLYSLFQEIWNGLRIYSKLSVKSRINFFPIAINIINHYLYYYSVFKHNRAQFCIQERHYQTNAIKNHLFRKFGGRYSASIQKNIISRGLCGFYYDIDVLFALGNKTTVMALEYGAIIGTIVPVGSLFMEYYWFTKKKSKFPIERKYDIVCFAGNGLGVGSIFDAYETYLQDYYEHFIWLAKLSKENPELVIGIKHHSNNKLDHREMEIIKNSNVVRIDQKLNSYEVGFQSNCCVTFASTIGYELIAHGIPTLFLDPGRRNSQFLPDNDLIEHWRVSTYEEFSVKIKNLLLEKDFGQSKTKVDDLCLNSQHVSERIHAWFNSN